MIEQQLKICPRCGTKAPLADAFCNSCGREYQTKFVIQSFKESVTVPQPTPNQDISAKTNKKALVRPVVLAVLLFVFFRLVCRAIIAIDAHNEPAHEVDQQVVSSALAAQTTADDQRVKRLEDAQNSLIIADDSFSDEAKTTSTSQDLITAFNNAKSAVKNDDKRQAIGFAESDPQLIVNLPALANVSPSVAATLLGNPVEQGTSTDIGTHQRLATMKYALPAGARGDCWIVYTDARAYKIAINFSRTLDSQRALSKVGIDTEKMQSVSDEKGIQFWHGMTQGVNFSRIRVIQGQSQADGTLVIAFVEAR